MRRKNESKILMIENPITETEVCIVIKHIEMVGMKNKEVIFFLISGKSFPLPLGSIEEAKSYYEEVL